MAGSVVTGVVGLVGAVIGGSTSFITSWITQKAQLQDKARAAERGRREKVYSEFIREATRLFGDALGHESDDVTNLVGLYAILARIRLSSDGAVVIAAERVLEAVAEAYLGPNRSLHELHQFAAGGGFDPFRLFSEACRQELERI